MGCGLALGTFDGVHIGHKKVLTTAAKEENSVAVAFSMPPKCYFDNTGIITDSKIKKQLILETGIKKVDYIDFNSVRNMSAREFLSMIFEKYKPTLISCGYNYRFGFSALGDTDLLQEYCDKNGAILSVCPPVTLDGKDVSSSVIREYITQGKIDEANKMLGYNYFIKSEVVHGRKLGREIGFPTANQILSEKATVPCFGVYASKVTVDNKVYKAVTNVGNNPTVNGTGITVESNIFDFSGEVYSKVIKTELIRFIRPEKTFQSLEELKKAIENDKKRALFE